MFKTIAATVVAASITFGGAAAAQAETRSVSIPRGEVASPVKVVNHPSMLNEEQGYTAFETPQASRPLPVAHKALMKKTVKKHSKKVVKRHHKVTRRIVRHHH